MIPPDNRADLSAIGAQLCKLFTDVDLHRSAKVGAPARSTEAARTTFRASDAMMVSIPVLAMWD